VTFGSVLTAQDQDARPRFSARLRALIEGQPDLYAANLSRHFARHLRPFATPGGSGR
jgi:hypothetical protein